MLIVEVWDGCRWQIAGRIRPGSVHVVTDQQQGDLLHLAVEEQRTVVSQGEHNPWPILELGPADEPWERVLKATWMTEPTLCRLRHSLGSPDSRAHRGHSPSMVPAR